MRGRLITRVGILSALALTVAACGDDGGDSAATTAPAAATTAAATTVAGGETTTTAGSATTASAATTVPKAASGTPFVVAMVTPLSGASAPFFTSIKTVGDLQVELFNARGGMGGHPLKIDYLDSAGTPAQATTALQSYLASNKPNAVWAGPTTGLVAPLLPILTEAKIFSVASTVAAEHNDPAKYPYHFPAAPTTVAVEESLIEALAAKGYKKAAFIGPDNGSGQSSLVAFQNAAKAKGMTVESVLADPTLVDVTPQLSKLKDANPDVIVYNGFGALSGVILKSKAKMSWDIPTYGDETFAANNLGTLASVDDLKGLVLQFFTFGTKGDPATQGATHKALYAALDKAGDTKVTAFWSAAINWNNLVTMKMAVDKAGYEATPEQLAKALESFQTIPAEYKDLWFGEPTLGYSATNHSPKWAAKDFYLVNAGPLEGGLLVPGA